VVAFNESVKRDKFLAIAFFQLGVVYSLVKKWNQAFNHLSSALEVCASMCATRGQKNGDFGLLVHAR
jgi:hypothetical protein